MFNDLMFVICDEYREKLHKKRVYFEMFTQTFENKLLFFIFYFLVSNIRRRPVIKSSHFT